MATIFPSLELGTSFQPKRVILPVAAKRGSVFQSNQPIVQQGGIERQAKGCVVTPRGIDGSMKPGYGCGSAPSRTRAMKRADDRLDAGMDFLAMAVN